MADSLRSKAVRKLDHTLAPHYVRQEDVVRALEELTRLLTDRFDAEAEAVAVLGQRLAALSEQVERLQDELHELRADS
jgi:CII-binding regulator of phage lambda lysogenization HflD